MSPPPAEKGKARYVSRGVADIFSRNGTKGAVPFLLQRKKQIYNIFAIFCGRNAIDYGGGVVSYNTLYNLALRQKSQTTDPTKEETSGLPEQYRPMGAWSYFGYTILFAIPLLGIICLIVFALDGSNVVRRSFARSYFCVVILAIILLLLFGTTLGAMFAAMSAAFPR